MRTGGGPPPEPPRPPPDFQYARKVTESEWSILQDIAAMPQEDRDQLRSELHAKAEKYRAYERELMAKLKLAKDST